MISAIVKTFNLGTVYEDSVLDTLAQNYTTLMIQDNMISHIDNIGRTPAVRAKAYDVTESIGENLAINNNLTDAQLMLQRSPAHLKNLVDPLWTRV